MRTILHIRTEKLDALAEKMATLHSEATGQTIEVVDLTVEEPDYGVLLERIFSADSVVVW